MNFFYDELNKEAEINGAIEEAEDINEAIIGTTGNTEGLVSANIDASFEECPDESEYIYGKLNKEVQNNEFTGVKTETTLTTVDNKDMLISVDVIKLPHKLTIQEAQSIFTDFDGSKDIIVDLTAYVKDIDNFSRAQLVADNLLKFYNKYNQELASVELSPFVQEQSDLAETDVNAETFVKNKSTKYLLNEGENGSSPYATEDYVDEFGGKIDVIKVNNIPLEIIDKTVNIETEWERGTGLNSIQSRNTGCQAIGDYSVAEGLNTITNSDYSHAEGYLAKTIIDTSDPDLKGRASHAEGSYTTAKGSASHAEGSYTTATGIHSHAEGYRTDAIGDDSHTEGNNTHANNFGEHAEGCFNVSHKNSDTYGDALNTQHSVGIGTAEIGPSGEFIGAKNAFEIMQNGDQYIIGIGNYDGKDIEDASTIQEVISDISDTLSPIPGQIETINTNISTLNTRVTTNESNITSLSNKINEDVEIKDDADFFTYDGDTVTFTEYYKNLSTGSTSQKAEHVALADSDTAGLMSPADVRQISDNTSRIEALEGQTIRLLYSDKENPTSQEIAKFIDDLGYIDNLERIGVVIAGTYHIWHYYTGSGWRDDGTDTVIQFTNEHAGIIKGATTDGQIYAESDGTGSVNGWSALKTRVTNLESTSSQHTQTISDLEDSLARVDLTESNINPGKLIFTNYNGQQKEVQGGFLPDSITIQLINETLTSVGVKDITNNIIKSGTNIIRGTQIVVLEDSDFN